MRSRGAIKPSKLVIAYTTLPVWVLLLTNICNERITVSYVINNSARARARAKLSWMFLSRLNYVLAALIIVSRASIRLCMAKSISCNASLSVEKWARLETVLAASTPPPPAAPPPSIP